MQQNDDFIVANPAYQLGSKHKNSDENIYDICKPDKKDRQKKRINCSLAVDAVAIVLAIVAILFAVVYTTVVWKVILDTEPLLPLLKDNSAQLNASKQQIYSLQAQLNESKQEINSLQTQLNKSEHEIDSIQTHILENQPAVYFADSCKDIPEDSSSGYYKIQEGSVEVYCDMNRTSCSCNIPGGWTRVANLDMTDSSQNCPDELRPVSRGEQRLCGRFHRCTSTAYLTYSIEYTHVCGRIIGYQEQSPDGFNVYYMDNTLTIDDGYVDGISLTHGQSPRKHIWTLAAALDEVSHTCNCINPAIEPETTPPFTGQDYFCDTGSREMFQHIFYPDDPLWDGAGCEGASACCEFNNPPWFCKQLPQPTTDDIELRICGDHHQISDEDILLELIEIYIR